MDTHVLQKNIEKRLQNNISSSLFLSKRSQEMYLKKTALLFSFHGAKSCPYFAFYDKI